MILESITAYPSISVKTMAEELGLTSDGIRYHINKLKKEGKIHREGPDKGGRWMITKKD